MAETSKLCKSVKSKLIGHYVCILFVDKTLKI